MDYEKKYNEALKWMRELYPGLHGVTKEDAEHYFPELRESEEEMTRKKAIAILKQQRDYWSYDGPIDKFPPATPRKDLVDAIDVALSYLEKQKEQKPAEWSEKDKDMLKRAIAFLAEDKTLPEWKLYVQKLKEWLKSLPERFELKPTKEWDEDDEDRIRQIERIAQQAGCTQKLQEEIHDWLKSLRPQPSWKPSGELLDSLRDTIVQTKGYSYSMYLPELYEQLKKL